MPSNLPLRCRCARVRGVALDVAHSSGFRFVCYCRDCQAFARFLERPDVLDSAGGPISSRSRRRAVKLTAGTDQLRCVRRSEKVLRSYTDCCRTPVGNTAADARFPLVALIHSFTDHEADGRSRDDALGPRLCRIYEGSAVGPLPPDAPPRPSLRVFALRMQKVISWWWAGLARPSPFFDPRTKWPIVAARVLSPDGAPRD